MTASGSTPPTKLGPPQRRRGPRSAAARGAYGLAFLAMVIVASFLFDRMPYVGAATTYQALFSEAAGLQRNNEVRIAGVKVGTVTDVALAGDKVAVSFRTRDVFVGDESSASIQIKTVLGQKYLALDSTGAHPLDPRRPITATTSPYDVVQAVSQASSSIDEIDQQKVAASLNAISGAFANTPDDVRSAVDGVRRLSETVAKRDEDVQKLLAATARTSEILASRTETFRKLISDAGVLLDELNRRQQSIDRLLTSTQTLSTTLTGIVRDNEKQIGPALDSLRQVVQLLQDNKKSLADTITLLAPFYRVYANVFGNGRWQESVVTNLTPPGLPLIPGVRAPYRNPLLSNAGN